MSVDPANYNTDNFVLVADYIKAKLEAASALGLQDVFYGDQELVPRNPAAAIETGSLVSELAGGGATNRTRNLMSIYILVYFSKVQDTQITRRECDLKSMEIRKVLHGDINMGGLVIYGYVTSVEPGYAYRGKVLMRTARITWVGQSKTMIA